MARKIVYGGGVLIILATAVILLQSAGVNDICTSGGVRDSWIQLPNEDFFGYRYYCSVEDSYRWCDSVSNYGATRDARCAVMKATKIDVEDPRVTRCDSWNSTKVFDYCPETNIYRLCDKMLGPLCIEFNTTKSAEVRELIKSKRNNKIYFRDKYFNISFTPDKAVCGQHVYGVSICKGNVQIQSERCFRVDSIELINLPDYVYDIQVNDSIRACNTTVVLPFSFKMPYMVDGEKAQGKYDVNITINGLQNFEDPTFSLLTQYNMTRGKLSDTIANNTGALQLNNRPLNESYWGTEELNETNYNLWGANLSVGLVGLWHLNNDTLDYSGRGNDLELDSLDTDCSTSVAGKVGTGCDFNGVGWLSPDDDLVGDFNLTDNFTVAVWVMPQYNHDVVQYVISKGSGCSSPRMWDISRGSDDLMTFYYSLDGTTNLVTSSTQSLSIGEWYHLTVTYLNGTVVLYINGNEDTTDSSEAGNGALSSNTYELRIGRGYCSDTNTIYNGTMDEVAIWNRSLTQAEITLIADGVPDFWTNTYGNGLVGLWNFDNQTGGGELNDSWIDYGWDYEEDLVGLWHFNNDTTDFSGQGNDGTLKGTNSSCESNATGKFGTGCNLDGMDDDIVLPSNVVDDPNLGITLSAWVYANSISDKMGIVGGAQSAGYTYYSSGGIWLDAGRPRMSGYNGSDYDHARATVINANKWTHITGVYNTTHLIIYVDGIERGATLFSSIGSSFITAYIGRNARNVLPYYFNGTIDEVAIWSRALTAGQISRLATGTTGIVNDFSGQGNDGTPVNITTCANMGKFGQACRYNGVDDYVDVADDDSLNFGLGNFSVTVWAKIDAIDIPSPSPSIIQKSDPAFEQSWYIDVVNTDGTPRFEVYNDLLSPANITVVGKTPVNDSTWHHLTATRYGNITSIYVDGVLEDSQISLIRNVSSSTYNLTIGAGAEGSYPLTGTLDDIGIWNRTLSASEISALATHIADSGTYNSTIHNSTSSRTVEWREIKAGEEFNYPVGELNNSRLDNWSGWSDGLVGLWHLNNDTLDYSGLGNDGTAYGDMDCSVDGKFGIGCQGNTNTSRIITSSSSDFDFSTTTNESTWSMWAKSKSSTQTSITFLMRASDDTFGILAQNDDYACHAVNGTNIATTLTNNLYGGQWKHHACVMENLGGANFKLTHYIDGVEFSNLEFTGSLASGDKIMTFGHEATSGSLDRAFNGTIDEVAIWNRSLSATEIRQLYGGGQDGTITYQVRTCTDETCSTAPPFVGYDGTINTVFTGGTMNLVNLTLNPFMQFTSIFTTQNETNPSPVIFNFSVTADEIPTITLDKPFTGTNTSNTSISFVCNVSDLDSDIANISLWANTSGTWALNQTDLVVGATNDTVGNFTLTNIPTGSYIWNCEARTNSSERGFFASSNYSLTSSLPDTNALSANFTVADFTFASTEYVTVFNETFNTSSAVSNVSIFTSMNLQKLTGGSSVVAMRLILDGVEIHDHTLSTLASLGDIKSTGLDPFFESITTGEHTLTGQIKRSGSGNVKVYEFDLIIYEAASQEGNPIGSQVNDFDTTFTNTTFSDVFTFEINKTINSSHVIGGVFNLNASELATITCRIKNLNDNSVSPTFVRTITSAIDNGTSSIFYVDKKEDTAHNHTLNCKTTAGSATINGSIFAIETADSSGADIQTLNTSNALTNGTSTLTFTAGLHNIASQVITLNSTTATGLMMMAHASIDSQSGKQTAGIFLNATNLPQTSLLSRKDRSFGVTNGQAGTLFLFSQANDLAQATEYNFTLWLNVSAGETVTLYDEGIVMGEISVLDTTTGNQAPIVIINSPANTTYINQTVALNMTASDVNNNLDQCWYSLNLGNTNTSIPDCSFVSDISDIEGNNTLRVYANDTLGLLNVEEVNYTIKTALPIIKIQSPTNTTYSNDTIALNFTIININNTIDQCWYSLDLGVTNTTLASCNNISDFNGNEGIFNQLRVYANNTFGILNVTEVNYSIVPKPPTILAIYVTDTAGDVPSTFPLETSYSFRANVTATDFGTVTHVNLTLINPLGTTVLTNVTMSLLTGSTYNFTRLINVAGTWTIIVTGRMVNNLNYSIGNQTTQIFFAPPLQEEVAYLGEVVIGDTIRIKFNPTDTNDNPIGLFPMFLTVIDSEGVIRVDNQSLLFLESSENEHYYDFTAEFGLPLGGYSAQVKAESDTATKYLKKYFTVVKPTGYPLIIVKQFTKNLTGISTTDDTWIDRNNPTTNHGSETTFSSGFDTNFQRPALVKFDTSSIDSSVTIGKSTMRLYVSSKIGCGGAGDLNTSVRLVTSSWSEGVVTWNTRPTNNDNVETSTIIEQADINRYYEWNITDITNKWINGSVTNNGVLLNTTGPSSGCSAVFDSSEGANKPELVIETTNFTYTILYDAFKQSILRNSDFSIIEDSGVKPWGTYGFSNTTVDLSNATYLFDIIGWDDRYYRYEYPSGYMVKFNQSIQERIENMSEAINVTVTDINATVKAMQLFMQDMNLSLHNKIDDVNSSISNRIDDVNLSISNRIDAINSSIITYVGEINTSINTNIDGVNQSVWSFLYTNGTETNTMANWIMIITETVRWIERLV